jgi:hypothetical protein
MSQSTNSDWIPRNSSSYLPLQGPQRARSAGASERYLIVRANLGIYNNVGLTIEYSRTRKDESTPIVPLKSVVYSAIARTIAKHACLSFVPTGKETNDPYYLRLPFINLDHAVSFTERRTPIDRIEDLELDEFLQDQHNKPFLHSDINLPYWRLFILTPPGNGPDFFAAFHHSLCDTRSALLFHQTFTEAFTRAEAELQTRSAPPIGLAITPEIALPPPIESLTSFPLSSDFKSNFVSSARKPTPLPNHVWTGEPARLPVQTRFRSLCIPASTTGEMVRACKENGTTVTAAVQAAVATVLFSLLPSTFTTLNCDGAISLPNPPISSSTMGVFVRSFSEHYQREDLFTKEDECREDPNCSCSVSCFWFQARRSLQNLKLIIADPTTDNPLIATTLLAEMGIGIDEYMLSKIGKKRHVSYEVSNIGTVVQQKYYDGEKQASVLEMGRTIFSQSAVAITTPLKISVATSVDGRLNLGFTWQVGGVVAVAAGQYYDEEEVFVVEGLIKGLRAFIERIVGRRVSEMRDLTRARISPC